MVQMGNESSSTGIVQGLEEILNKVASDRVEPRQQGLKALVQVIKEDGKKSKRLQIPNKGYHTILEALFRGARSENAYYAKASKSTAAKAESRLSEYASLVRWIVELNVRKLSTETVRAIVEHTRQILPDNDDGYCFPLVSDYIKALVQLFQYKAHVENLRLDEIQAIISFCLDMAHDASKPQAESNENSSRDSEPQTSQKSLSFRLGQAGVSSVNSGYGRSMGSYESQRMMYPKLQNSAAAIVTCLQHIISVPCVHVSDQAERLATVMFALLRDHPSVSAIQQPAFETINYIMPQLLTSNTALAINVMRRFIVLVRHFWQTRASGLKEILMSILLHGEFLIAALLEDEEGGDARSALSSVLEIFRQEYFERRVKDRLLLDDIDLSDYTAQYQSGNCLLFKLANLRQGNVKAEEPWAFIHINAKIIMAMHGYPKPVKHLEVGGEAGRQTKRQRLSTPLDELLGLLSSNEAHRRIYALQVLAVILDSHDFDASELHDHLETLLIYLSDENSATSSWAMFSFACGINQLHAKSESLKKLWCRVWRLVVRQITSPGTCRASCYLSAVLLDTGIVAYGDVADVIDNLLSTTELNGPADFDEAAAKFWQVVLHAKGEENVSSVTDTSTVVLLWLFKRWIPGIANGSARKTDSAFRTPIFSAVGLICTCLGIPLSLPKRRADRSLGRILQTHLEAIENQQLIRYLALHDESIEETKGQKLEFKSDSPEPIFARSTGQTILGKTLEFLTSEVSRLIQNHVAQSSPTAPASHVTADFIHSASSLCIISYTILSSKTQSHQERSNSLQKASDELKDNIRGWILKNDRPQELSEGLVQSFGEFVWPINEIIPENNVLLDGAIKMSEGLGPDFWMECESSKTVNKDQAVDAMDIDEDFGNQSQDERQKEASSDLAHNDLIASTCKESFRTSTIAVTCFMSMLNQPQGEQALLMSSANSAFVTYLTSQNKRDFLLCRRILREFLHSKFPLTEDDADTILQYLSQTYTEKYETRRSEVAISMCLDTMTDLVQMWTFGGSECAGAAAELYLWFNKEILEVPPLSSKAYRCATSLFQAIMKTCPDYARDLNLPSARTSLFEVLKSGDLKVKFHVGQTVSDIFALFVLKEHENILQDVVENLPSDADWVEGIALRLFVLARLASSWSTLLRRCVYAIFETPGQVELSTGHAKSCLKYVAKSLGLGRCQDLFRLFASQILYTWLESESLSTIPYGVFDYSNLQHMLRDGQDEVCGQIIMRGKDDEAQQLVEYLGLPLRDMLETSFSKVIAYSVARDISFPSNSKDRTPGGESRLRKLFGKEAYAALVTKHFADTLALFFTGMDFADQIERAFQKRDEYSFANTAYREMIANGASDLVLPPNQQPSFRAKYLIDQIDYVCRRTHYDPNKIWTPAVYTYVLRRLLHTIHPALGSLHACSVVRKIRILVSLSGSTALEGYPLEMALHAFRPLLVNPQCADDAIGVVQYLIANGATYLATAPSFLTGNTASILISLRAFFDSTQDSTTQESQFKATLAKAHKFHGWLAAFLAQYTSEEMTVEASDAFRRVVRSASNFQGRSSSRSGTHESDLLLELLEDERSGRDLLNRSSRDSILQMFCDSFEPAPGFRNDILGQDKTASLYAPIVWKTCQRGIGNADYLEWCGQVLGRAYVGTGQIDNSIIYEVPSAVKWASDSESVLSLGNKSRTNILESVCALLYNNSQDEVGVAEATLRYVVTNANGTDVFDDCEQVLPKSLVEAFLWTDYALPSLDVKGSQLSEVLVPRNLEGEEGVLTSMGWIQDLFTELGKTSEKDPILDALPHLLSRARNLSEQTIPYVLHLMLLRDIDKNQNAKRVISQKYGEEFLSPAETGHKLPLIKVLLNAILYLHTQPMPDEGVKADRFRWLDIDYQQAARVAANCAMYKTALLLLELHHSQLARTEAQESRRSSTRRKQEDVSEPTDLLLDIYHHLDEEDAFYGIHKPSSLASMMTQLEYENAGFKALSFRGAFYDSQLRFSSNSAEVDSENMLRVLGGIDLNGLSQSVLGSTINTGPRSIDVTLRTARRLEKWDISAPSAHVSAVSVNFRGFQGINIATDPEKIKSVIHKGYAELMQSLMSGKVAHQAMHQVLAGLAVLSETHEIFCSQGIDQMQEIAERFEAREEWMKAERYGRIDDILSCRETVFGSLSKRASLRDVVKLSERDSRALEARALLASTRMSRDHGVLQNALTAATYLNQLIKPCHDTGVNIENAVQYESAQVLWDQGEMTASIRMLQALRNAPTPASELVNVGRANMLAKLGHQIAEARLEKPDEIIKSYLMPAIKAINNSTEGTEASEVFHEFAFFCDQQLQNPDTLEDFQRIKKLRELKGSEVQGLENLLKKAPSQGKENMNLKNYRNKARLWYDLDNREYQRLLESRQTFLKQSLENYLLSLRASDRYDNDALRFSALWLENFDSDIANAAVSKHIGQVGSRKFAPLMNQWASRLLEKPSDFQATLFTLVLKICVEHPYHGMYQIFVSSKSKGSKDEIALARYAAANKIVDKLKANKRSGGTWLALHNTNVNFVRFAIERFEDSSIKQGSKVPLKKFPAGQRVEQDVNKYYIPPPTMTISLRPDCDYSSVPHVKRFMPEFTIASGISAPKILTAVGSDGLRYKQLFKGGNDDLRQDAIMEQVFAAVSSLLATQRSTRQRSLKIRSYKVLPLTATAGIIEFVANTIPLHDYLLPAHQRHYPRDLKPNVCRKYISDVQSSSVEERVKAFRKVTAQFHPVLRHFYFERFESPDIWYETRLAYTRSTAAISILGHILGLGDRHGHNILLDETTGEVVHIDLGIAFEQGRVLPVPEVVPFRLTRDLVDAMGITGTEGVFRRCCEFTLEALRNESYSIMTILDVLRYDPLYSWSLSPLRMKKLQEQGDEGGGGPDATGAGAGGGNGKEKDSDDPGEADRALTVVKKKLSKSLSVQATVNELIQTATDERNLAVLFCGWAAYA